MLRNLKDEFMHTYQASKLIKIGQIGYTIVKEGQKR